MGYPTNTARKPSAAAQSQDERLGGLLGDRGRADPNLRALTRGDAAGAGAITLQATTVTAAPTAAEHNALVADIRALATVLNALGAKINFT